MMTRQTGLAALALGLTACGGGVESPAPPADITPPVVQVSATGGVGRGSLSMGASEDKSPISSTQLYLNGTLVRSGTGALSVQDTTLAAGNYSVRGVATSAGGTGENTSQFLVTAPPVQVNIRNPLVTPSAVLQGDSAVVSATGDASDLSPVALSATYNGQTIGQGTQSLQAKLQATNQTAPVITGTSGATSVQAPTTWSYTPLSITASPNSTSAQVGQSIAIPYNTQTGADSSGFVLSDGRRFVSAGGGSKTATVPLTAPGTLTATPITYNGKPAVSATGTPVTLTGTAAPVGIRLKMRDVEQDPRNASIDPYPISRYNLLIDGVVKNLPADTTIQLNQGNHEIRVPLADAGLEPLIGAYKNGTMVGVMDENNKWNLVVSTPETFQLDGIKRGRPHFSGLAREVAMVVYTDIWIDVSTTIPLPTATFGKFHPTSADTLDAFIRTTKYLANGITKWDDMPAAKVPEFIAAYQWLNTNSVDKFGRRTQEYNIHTENFADSMMIARGAGLGPTPNKVVIGWRSSAADGGAYYGLINNGQAFGALDAFTATTGTGPTATAEMLDLLRNVSFPVKHTV